MLAHSDPHPACRITPCCRRSFENLRCHMSAKHPEFDPTDTNIVALKTGRN